MRCCDMKLTRTNIIKYMFLQKNVSILAIGYQPVTNSAQGQIIHTLRNDVSHTITPLSKRPSG